MITVNIHPGEKTRVTTGNNGDTRWLVIAEDDGLDVGIFTSSCPITFLDDLILALQAEREHRTEHRTCAVVDCSTTSLTPGSVYCDDHNGMVADRDPIEVYGTPEHEAWLMEMERRGDYQ